MSKRAKFILLDDQLSGHLRYYENPVDIVTAFTPEALLEALDRLQAYQKAGYYLAGYMSYEVGYVFEPSLSAHVAVDPQDSKHSQDLKTPLLSFGVFKAPSSKRPKRFQRQPSVRLHMRPEWSLAHYEKRAAAALGYIKRGFIYQLNLTFPMSGEYTGEIEPLYEELRRTQPSHFGACLSLDGPEILSLSPELFFRLDGRQITTRPMKGTMKRSQDADGDMEAKFHLKTDPKSQAENLMIVDLLRNDLSRIGEVGSVRVPKLFTIETYPTLHQMTSTITARIHEGTSVKDIWQALFPCGSVTGAPKIMAMKIIRELEAAPRGAYCGSIGYIDPDGSACFSVAIRTLTRHKETRPANKIEYRVGSGLVADSHIQDEYKECLLKAAVLSSKSPELIETMRWGHDVGVLRLDMHLDRLAKSAAALGYAYDEGHIRTALKKAVSGVFSDQKLRLILSADGQVKIHVTPYVKLGGPLRVMMSKHLLSASVQESRYKVSERAFYDGERARLQEQFSIDEVIFLNPSGRVCEGSFTNIFVKAQGGYLTPPLTEGLLPGVLRREMLETGKAKEAVLTPQDLMGERPLYVGNSLRGLMPARMIKPDPS